MYRRHGSLKGEGWFILDRPAFWAIPSRQVNRSSPGRLWERRAQERSSSWFFGLWGKKVLIVPGLFFILNIKTGK
jgi:hypothetical protein